MSMLVLRYLFSTVLTNRLANNSANMFNSDSAYMFNSKSVNILAEVRWTCWTSDLANMFTSASDNMFTSDLANMFTSVSANMFTSDLANMFTSASANVFTSELEKCKKVFCPTCSLAKLTGEYVRLVPVIRQVILSYYPLYGLPY